MTEEQNTNNTAGELNVRFEGALTSTPIQREEELLQTKNNTKRISPNRTISEAKKVGNRRVSPKNNTVNRGQKRKNTSKSPNYPFVHENVLTEDETILLDIPKKRLSFSSRSA